MNYRMVYIWILSAALVCTLAVEQREAFVVQQQQTLIRAMASNPACLVGK